MAGHEGQRRLDVWIDEFHRDFIDDLVLRDGTKLYEAVEHVIAFYAASADGKVATATAITALSEETTRNAMLRFRQRTNFYREAHSLMQAGQTISSRIERVKWQKAARRFLSRADAKP